MGLDGVELIMEVEQAFEVDFGDLNLSHVRTARQLAEIVLEVKYPGVRVTEDERQPVLERVMEVVATTLSVKRDRVTPDADFFEDLGMD